MRALASGSPSMQSFAFVADMLRIWVLVAKVCAEGRRWYNYSE